MRAAVVRQYGQVAVEEIDVPRPGQKDVLVRTVASGICRSDLTVFDGDVPVPLPLVLGHEGAGIVEAVGTAVSTLKVGDHVVLSITNGCGLCFQCQVGARGLCERNAPQGLAGTMGDGSILLHKGDEQLHHFLFQSSLSEYCVVAEPCAVLVPPDVPLDVACLLGCGFTTGFGAVVNRAQVRPGATVLIIGLGGVGLSAVMGARVAGASMIIGVDRNPAACVLAEELGATHVLAADDDIVGAVMSLTRRGVDHAFDVVGTSPTVGAAFAAIRNGGEVVVVGLGDVTATADVPLLAFMYEKRISGTTNGSIRPHVDIPLALDMYRAGRLPIDRLISKRYELSEISTAFAEMGNIGGRSIVTFP